MKKELFLFKNVYIYIKTIKFILKNKIYFYKKRFLISLN